MRKLLGSRKSLYKQLSLVALIGLGLALVWLDDLQPVQPSVKLPNQYGEPDFFVYGAEIHRYDAQGQIEQYVTAKEAVSYPDKQLIEFIEPKIFQYTNNEVAWLLEADSGQHLPARDNQPEQTLLNTNLLLTPLQPTSEYTPRIATSSLTINHQDNQATSPDAVSLISPRGITQGEGLLLDFNEKSILLKSRVTSSYLSPNQPINSNLP